MNQRHLYSLIAFSAGAAVMIFEITAARAIAPYLGNSLITWTSLIGVVLVSLSIGNWLGGHLADRTRSPITLGTILLTAALVLAVTNLGKSLLLDGLGSWNADLRIRTVLAALVLLAPVGILLGMVSPYITRSLLTGLEKGGRTIGLVSALGNLGSIIGTFLAGFVLLPSLGTSTVLTVVALGLALLAALVGFGGRRIVAGTVALVLTAAIPGGLYYRNSFAEAGFIDADTPYSRVWIGKAGIGEGEIQYFQIDRQFSSARYAKSDELVFAYNRAFRVADLFQPNPQNTLLIGGAGYTFHPDFFRRHPNATMDVVEIDPGVTHLAQRHFGLTNDRRLRIIHEDGRTFLNRNTERYDTIYIDAYSNQFSVPFQLVTVEAVKRFRASITDEGIIVANIISALEGPRAALLEAIVTTFHKEFSDIRVISSTPSAEPTQVQNVVMLATPRQFTQQALPRSDEESDFLSTIREVGTGQQKSMTDELAPIDRYTNALWLN
jgi:spermidine synthase